MTKRYAPCIHCGSMKCQKDTVQCLNDRMNEMFASLWRRMRELELIISDDEIMTRLLLERVNTVRLDSLVPSGPKGDA